MKLFTVIVFFLVSFFTSIAQEIIIKAANTNGKAALFFLSGEKVSFVDSISLNNNGVYILNLQNNHSGFYRLIFNDKNPSLYGRAETSWLDFIYDNKDVEMETDANNILDSLKIIKSESNKIYYDFIKLNKNYKTKSELLQIILANYPESDDYYQTTKEKLIKVQEEYLYFVNVTSQSIPNSYVARYVRSAQLPVIEAEAPFYEQLLYLKTNSLNNVNFNDGGLIYSDAFANKS